MDKTPQLGSDTAVGLTSFYVLIIPMPLDRVPACVSTSISMLCIQDYIGLPPSDQRNLLYLY
jgi:hypothetical protein